MPGYLETPKEISAGKVLSIKRRLDQHKYQTAIHLIKLFLLTVADEGLEDLLNQYKQVLIKYILTEFQAGVDIGNNFSLVSKLVDSLIQTGIKWPELNTIQRSIEADMSIERKINEDANTTINIQSSIKEFIENNKVFTIKRLLGNISKHGRFSNKSDLLPSIINDIKELNKLGINWTELTTIKKSVDFEMKKENINESISNNPNINTQIEKVLDGFSHIDQTHILDALEILQDAGANGLSPSQWSESMKKLYPENDFSVMDTLKNAVKKFPFCVRRAGEKNYVWDDTIRDAVKDAVGQQTRMTYAGLDLMKELGRFTLDELAAKMVERFQMPIELANKFADHLINTIGSSSVTELGDGKFMMKQTSEPEHTDQIANLLKNAGLRAPD